MDGAHVHLLLNHIPVLGTLFCVLLLAFALLRKSGEVLRVALLGTVLVALVTFPAYLSGESAEDAVKRLGSPDISTIMLDEHEDAALPAMLTVEGTGVLALLALVLGRGGRRPGWLPWAVLAAGGLGFALVARAANLGGQIHHPEIRAGAPAASGGEDDDHRGRKGR